MHQIDWWILVTLMQNGECSLTALDDHCPLRFAPTRASQEPVVFTQDDRVSRIERLLRTGVISQVGRMVSITAAGCQAVHDAFQRSSDRHLQLDEMQEAARLIEIDGDEAFHTVSRRYGAQAARLLLVAHLRRAAGSMTGGHPPSRDIDEQVEAALAATGII